MGSRVAVISIIVENPDSVEKLNALLHGILRRSLSPFPELLKLLDAE